MNTETKQSAWLTLWAAIKYVLFTIFLAIRWVAMEIIIPACIWISRWFAGCCKSILMEREFRRGVLFTFVVFAIVAIIGAIGHFEPWVAHGWWDAPDYQHQPSTDRLPSHLEKIREARKGLGPVHASILPHATKQYNAMVAEARWRNGARNCLRFVDEFRRVEELTGYPAAFTAGLALHESDGCRQGASDWAGGKGLMQITGRKSAEEKRRASLILGIPMSKLDVEGNTLHNLVLGVIILDAYERLLGSRPHGLLAYNMGPGDGKVSSRRYRGVRDYIAKMGRSVKSPPTIAEMRMHLPYERRMKPRVYVEKVLASITMMQVVMMGQELTKKTRLNPKDVPGFNPAADGRWPVPHPGNSQFAAN